MTDVEGSSQLFERRRDAMERAMARHDRVLTDNVESNGGFVVTQQGEGDSMFAVFTSSRSALNAALDGQRAFHQQDWPVPMRVRMGVLTGDARVVNGNYRGQAINRCGRIRSAAPGGQIFVAQSTATMPDNLPDGAAFAMLGELSLKGLEKPELVYRLVHPDIAEQRV
jgi:class 3 adenylate cyclase